ncbi:MAG: hypothetical protein MJA84_16185 [Firmicutes bacterium]|nr:hypothetical protein [Bacillota bacterium]
MQKKEMYRKEILLTVGFTALFILLGHSASIFVLFPGLQGGWMWGFPVHYIVPVLLGWFGLTAAGILMAIVMNKFDDDMEAMAQGNQPASPPPSPTTSAAKGE